MSHQEETVRSSNERGHDELLTSGAITTVGFGLCRAWIVFCLSAGVATSEPSGINWHFLAAGALAAFLCAAADGKKPFSEKKRSVFSLALVACVALSCAFMTAAACFHSTSLMTVALMAGGAGAALLQIAWGTCFTRHDPKFALACTPAAAIVTGTTLAVISTELSAFVLIVMPVASLCLLALETTREFATLHPRIQAACQKEEPRNQTQPTHGEPTMRLMFSAAAFAFLVRIFDAMPVTGNDPFAPLGGSATFSLVVVGVLFIAIVGILRKKHFDILLVYRLSLPLMAFGLTVVALFYDQHAAVSIALVCIGYELFDLLSWVLFSGIAQRKGQSAYRAFGMGIGCTFAGMAGGYAVGQFAIAPSLQNGSIETAGVAIIATTFLVITAFLVLPESALGMLLQKKAKDDTPPPRSPMRLLLRKPVMP